MSSGWVGFVSGIVFGGSVSLFTVALLLHRKVEAEDKRVHQAYQRGVLDYRRYRIRRKDRDDIS